jgi:teichuronic acid biosynthesis glycosyltransferase TuaG
MGQESDTVKLSRYSVVLPTFNSERTVRAAIDSVLAQTVPAGEIIIVDDASTDGTIDLIRRIESDVDIRVLRKSINSGPAVSRNMGIDASRFPAIAFIDSDDCWVPDKMAKCLDVMAHRDSRLIGHRYAENVVDSSDVTKTATLYTLGLAQMFLRNHVQTSCLVFDKTALNLRFPEYMRYCEDYAAILKCMVSEGSKLIFIDEVLTVLGRPQLSPGGLSENRSAMRRGELEAYRYSTHSSRYAPLLPFLFVLSGVKHLRKLINAQFR